jgi:hypothetical protein
MQLFVREMPMTARKLVFAGSLATLVVSMASAPFAFYGSFPRLDYVTTMVTHRFGVAVSPNSAGWWIGTLEHVLQGCLLLPLLFGKLAHRFPSSWRVIQGAAWGFTLWLFLNLVVKPLAGIGIFGSVAEPPGLALGVTLATHLLYGAFFGAVLGRSSAWGIRRTSTSTQETDHADAA